MARVDAYEKITEQITSMLETGTVPWRKPWNAAGSAPTSLSTGKPYRGINVMILSMTALVEGYASPFWGTYKQITERGGQVNKGEKATHVTLWTKAESKKEKDANGDPKTFMFMRTFPVFSVDQADWSEGVKPERPALAEHDPIAEAEAIAEAYLADGPSFSTGGGRAYYSPSRDAVCIPEMGTFHTPEGYYATLFHELTHSTGHVSRLARDGVTEGHRFGDADYSKEELVAELGAAFLCAETGINPDETLANSASYIANWLRVLKDDPKMIVQAASKAQKAAELVVSAGATEEEASKAA